MTKSSSFISTGATIGIACSITAVVSYYIAVKESEKKVLLEKKKAWDRDLLLKEKTIAARQSGEPKGQLISDVTVDKVYLWEIEDLKKRFSPCNVRNVMKNIPSSNENPYYFPSLSKSPTSIAEKDFVRTTDYNKLITNHECILGEIVRKPNQPTHARAYVRAGPRRYVCVYIFFPI